MAINFPNSPTNGQQITEGNIKYVYNSAKGYWESSDTSVTTGFATESFVNNAISNSSSTTIVADMAGLIALTGMSAGDQAYVCLLYTSPSPRDLSTSRMPSSA